MLTKKQLCNALLQRNGIEIKDITGENSDRLTKFVMQSSQVAVAAEYLGLLENNAELKAYAQERAGIILQCTEEKYKEPLVVSFLTVRELLELLPE